MWEWLTELQEWRSGRCERHLRLKRESQRWTETRVFRRVEPGMVLFTWEYIAPFTRHVPVFKFAQSFTTSMTIFSSQLFLVLAESVSVKVALYKRRNLFPVLCYTTDEASQSLGWTVWLPEALQAGGLELIEEWLIEWLIFLERRRNACEHLTRIFFFRDFISYCWYNPQPMRNDHSIAGTTILQTTLEDADSTQYYWWLDKSGSKGSSLDFKTFRCSTPSSVGSHER